MIIYSFCNILDVDKNLRLNELNHNNKFGGIAMQIQQLQKDMIAAMKARDKVRKDAISSLVAAVKKLLLMEGIVIISQKNW